MQTFTQAPLAQLPYTINWSRWLDKNEALETVTWKIPTDLTSVNSSFDSVSATIWITTPDVTSGQFIVSCSVVSNGTPEKLDTRSFIIKVALT